MARKTNPISKIAVRNFKSIWDEQQIELKPLTLLAGANSSGKSSIMQPILLLKQTIEAPGDPGALLLDGPNVRFTKADQLLSQLCKRDAKKEFYIRVELSEDGIIELLFHKEKDIGFDIIEMIYTHGDKIDKYYPEMKNEDIIKIIPEPFRGFPVGIFNLKPEDVKWAVYRDRCFLSFALQTTKGELKRSAFGPYRVSPSASLIAWLLEMIHLPGLRGNPQRTYQKSAAGPNYSGTFEPYVASIIAQWQAEDNVKLAELGGALEEMGLTWKVKSRPVDDTKVELMVGRLPHSKRGGAQDLVSIADVGFGVSQSLPVVVALIAARSGQVVYLEQPEIHLHPRAQRRLAHVIKGATKRGVIVIVETHSVLLLREVQTLVATGEMPAEDVKLHWFQRNEKGCTTISATDLDNKGAYGSWPEDFDDVELDAEKAYLDAVEKQDEQ